MFVNTIFICALYSSTQAFNSSDFFIKVFYIKRQNENWFLTVSYGYGSSVKQHRLVGTFRLRQLAPGLSEDVQSGQSQESHDRRRRVQLQRWRTWGQLHHQRPQVGALVSATPLAVRPAPLRRQSCRSDLPGSGSCLIWPISLKPFCWTLLAFWCVFKDQQGEPNTLNSNFIYKRDGHRAASWSISCWEHLQCKRRQVWRWWMNWRSRLQTANHRQVFKNKFSSTWPEATNHRHAFK